LFCVKYFTYKIFFNSGCGGVSDHCGDEKWGGGSGGGCERGGGGDDIEMVVVVEIVGWYYK